MARLSLVLAHGPGQPDGDEQDRLELHLGLTAQAGIDEPAYAASTQPWRVIRQIPGEPVRIGQVLKTNGRWGVRRIAAEDGFLDDDPICMLEARTFRPGDYVTLRSPLGEELIFRIVDVESL
jgi:hypothetical protein